MPNHFHLVIRTRQPNLSLAMRQLDGCFAQWWNKRHAHIGHVFQARFKAQVVESTVYLVRLCRYVLLNPVRAGLCAHPRDWPWGSYKALVSGKPSPYVDVESLVRHIDPDNPASVLARLITYVAPETDPEMAAFIRSDRRVIGTPAFAEQFRRQARAASAEVPAKERRTGARPLVEILAAAIEDGEGLAAGVRRAREAGYQVSEIARCSGLSPNVVTRMTGGALVRRRPGTGKRRIGDLAPEFGGTET
jgi:hypothetical protein